MPEEFAEWLRGELAERGLSQRELARRSGMTSPGVSQIVRGKVQPTVESIYKIAEGLELDPLSVLHLAGVLPDTPPEATDEEEAVRILRAKPYHPRQVAVWMLRGIHAEYQQGAEPRTLQDGDRVRIVRIMQEGMVVGNADEPDHYVVSIDGSRNAFHADELIEVGTATVYS